MFISAPRAAAVASHPIAPSDTSSSFRPGGPRIAALLDISGAGFFAIADTMTGYGRPSGYGSLADARRAAFQLTVGADSPAAGIYRTGSTWYVRAMGAVPGEDPHKPEPVLVPGKPAALPTMSMLHFEGRSKTHFAWVSDPRLVLLVDGATQVWSRDAHHNPPADRSGR